MLILGISSDFVFYFFGSNSISSEKQTENKKKISCRVLLSKKQNKNVKKCNVNKVYACEQIYSWTMSL